MNATALLTCKGADGIVVSADSRGHSLKGEVEDYDKLQVVGERVVVAEAGLLLIRDKSNLRFDVHRWVAEATRKLGPRPSVEVVVEALAKAAPELRALTKLPSVTRAERPQIILLVAGFDKTPSVHRLVIDLRPFKIDQRPQNDDLVAVGLGAGHLDPEGTLFSLAKKRRPELGKAETLAARADWCGWLLTVESELNPLVALPIRQVLVGPLGATRRVFAAP